MNRNKFLSKKKDPIDYCPRCKKPNLSPKHCSDEACNENERNLQNIIQFAKKTHANKAVAEKEGKGWSTMDVAGFEIADE